MDPVKIAQEIITDPTLQPLVVNANQVLKTAVGPVSWPRVTAEWSVGKDRGNRPLLRLKLSDFTGETLAADFAPDELKNDWQTGGRMLRLWSDLLQVRSHQQVEAILRSSADTGTD